MTVMKIYKHLHRSFMLPMFWNPRHPMRFNVCFDNTARYFTENPENQLDWNKLYGMTFGILPVFDGEFHLPIHWRSLRFAWRYNPEDDVVEVCPYIYFQGDVFYHENDLAIPICELVIGNIYLFEIKPRGDVMYMVVKAGSKLLLEYYIDMGEFDIGWACYPYFGGNERAPHTIDIDFEYAE